MWFVLGWRYTVDETVQSKNYLTDSFTSLDVTNLVIPFIHLLLTSVPFLIGSHLWWRYETRDLFPSSALFNGRCTQHVLNSDAATLSAVKTKKENLIHCSLKLQQLTSTLSFRVDHFSGEVYLPTYSEPDILDSIWLAKLPAGPWLWPRETSGSLLLRVVIDPTLSLNRWIRSRSHFYTGGYELWTELNCIYITRFSCCFIPYFAWSLKLG